MSVHFQYTKPKRLLDKAAEDPKYVIRETFETHLTEGIRLQLNYWLSISTDYIYENSFDRLVLEYFHNGLQNFIQALDAIFYPPESGGRSKTWIIDSSLKQTIDECNHKLGKMEPEQLTNPQAIIASFFETFSLEYIRQEMWEWLVAGHYYKKELPEQISHSSITFVYNDVLCLVEAAYVLYGKGD